MKVSIITIAYNSEETLEDTIVSVAKQTHPNIEYILVDGASTDSTLSIAKKHSNHIQTLISEPDKGIYDAMNKGVAAATGDIIGILNSDDFYADDSVIADVVAKFASSGTQGLYANLVYVDRNDTDKVIRLWESKTYVKGMFRKGWMPAHPTFFVQKQCYDAYGTYNTELRSAADYELMLRFIEKHQISVTHLNRVITKMRVGGQSNVSFKNRVRANKEDRKAWTMNGLKPAWYTLFLKPLSKLGQFIKR